MCLQTLTCKHTFRDKNTELQHTYIQRVHVRSRDPRCAQISFKSSKSAQVTGTSPPECQPEPTQLPLPHSGGAAGPITACRAESRGGAGEERGEEPDQGCTAEANSGAVTAPPGGWK